MVSKELKTIRCKASICWGPDQPLTMEEIEVAPPQVSEVRVRILFASLCHSDVSCWNGFPTAVYPRVLGHEGVGVIESIGEGVEDLNEGDLVIPSYIGECGECKNCNSGKTNQCLKHPLTAHGLMPDMTSRMSIKGQILHHLMSCSTFTEYTVVNTNYIVKVDPRLVPTHASLLSCGFTTGWGAVVKEAQIEQGSTVAVFGLGGVGIGAVVGAKLLGASKIIGVDLNEKKKAKAEHFGVTDFVNPKSIGNKSTSEVIKEMTGGEGVDYSFECSGAGPAISDAFEAIVMGTGVTVVVGAAAEPTASINRWSLLFGRTLKGCIFGGIKPRSELPSIVAKCIHKEIQLDEMITHQVDLHDVNLAFELMKQPDCLKVVININNE